MEQEKKIIEIIEKLRPYLIGDGGDLEFVKYEDHIVYVRLLGACANCNMIDITLKDGIEATSELKKEIQELCRKNVSKYAIPAEYEYRKQLPKTLVGKVAFAKLEEENKKDEK